MANANPTPSPNPNALKFELDVTLPATISYSSADAAAGDPFGAAVFEAPGVASIFGVNDFVTVNRSSADADWEPIIQAVQAAAAAHL
jgi:hypothetical protein